MKKLAVRFLPVVALSGLAASAHAELPAAVGTAITSIQGDATDLLALLYPAMIAIAGGFIIFGLVKRGIKKAV